LPAIWTHEFITKPKDVKGEPPQGVLRADQHRRRNDFILWTRSAVLRRSYLLRVSVISLGFGILFLPAPYLDLAGNAALVWILMAVGAILVFLLPWLISWLQEEPEQVS